MKAFDEGDRLDAELAGRAASGDSEALTELVRRHQSWLYNVALRLVLSPADAEDLAQETVVRIVTRLSTFEARSSFRTWAYRILKNVFLDAQRRPMERAITSFDAYGEELDGLPLEALAEPGPGPERQLLVEEASVGCMLGMLLCLDREQRWVFVLGEIFGVPSSVGAEIMEIGAAAFRKRLERARSDLAAFMQGTCGLVDPANPCRCHKKTKAFIREGWVDPENLKFVDPHVRRLEQLAPDAQHVVMHAEERAAALFRSHPQRKGPDFSARLRALVQDPDLRATFGLA
ncbi:MAG: RNA polymerase sigma factor [Myxococcota bacterium]